MKKKVGEKPTALVRLGKGVYSQAPVNSRKKTYGVSSSPITRLGSDNAFLTGPASKPGMNPAFGISNAYGSHAWVYACVRVLAQRLSSVPAKFYTGPVDAPTEVTLLSPGAGGNVVRLFNRPNSHMTNFQLWELTTTLMNIDGWCVWLLDRPNVASIPTAIYPVRACNIQELLRDRATGEVIAVSYLNPLTQTLEPYAMDQVVVTKFVNPFDDFRGMSPLQAAARGVSLDILATEYSRAFFGNNADPDGVILAEKRLTPKQAKEILDWWEARHQGFGNAKKVGILYGNMKWQGTSVNQRDAEYINQRKMTREEIFAVYGVPASELSITEDVTHSTSVSQGRGFWEKTLIPQLQNYEASINAQFCAGLQGILPGLRLKFDLSVVHALQPNLTELIDNFMKLAQIGYPINDVNEKLGLGMPRQDWGDTWFLNGAMATVQQIMSGALLPAKPSHPSVPGGDGKPADNSPADPLNPSSEKPQDNSSTGQGTAVSGKEITLAELDRDVFSKYVPELKTALRAYLNKLRSHQLAECVRGNGAYSLSKWDERLSTKLFSIRNKLAVDLSSRLGRVIPDDFVLPGPVLNVPVRKEVEEKLHGQVQGTPKALDDIRVIFNGFSERWRLEYFAKMEIAQILKQVETFKEVA